MDWIIDWLKPEQALSKTRLSTFGLCKISLNLNLEGEKGGLYEVNLMAREHKLINIKYLKWLQIACAYQYSVTIYFDVIHDQ